MSQKETLHRSFQLCIACHQSICIITLPIARKDIVCKHHSTPQYAQCSQMQAANINMTNFYTVQAVYGASVLHVSTEKPFQRAHIIVITDIILEGSYTAE